MVYIYHKKYTKIIAAGVVTAAPAERSIVADNEKYYYLRLKEDFFEDDAIQIIEAMPDGYLYCNILLKLYLKSLKFNGKLMFNERIPYNTDVLAVITRHKVGVIEKALEIFKDMGIIDILDNGAMYILDIQNFIGKTSTEADRKRSYREKIEQEKIEINGQMSGQISDKSTLEIDIEKEIEKKIDKEPKNNVELIKNIINYLNEKAGTNYRYQTSTTQKFINARLSENFTVDNFKTVIDKKVTEWKKTDMEKFIRPETLFGAKFESYLNQKISNLGQQQKPNNNNFNNFPQREYDYDDLERQLIGNNQ